AQHVKQRCGGVHVDPVRLVIGGQRDHFPSARGSKELAAQDFLTCRIAKGTEVGWLFPAGLRGCAFGSRALCGECELQAKTSIGPEAEPDRSLNTRVRWELRSVP